MLLCAVGIVPSAHGAFPGANGRIAFSTDRDGNLEIYSMNPDGSDQRRLTYDPSFDLWPAWSPDGTRIAFIRSKSQGQNGGGDLWVMNADSTAAHQLTNEGDINLHPSWSPDGQKIVFESGRNGAEKLYVINADGSDEGPVGDIAGRDPAWSPDGTRIAYYTLGGFNDLFTVRPDGTERTDVTLTQYEMEASPSWSPDGHRLVFTAGNNDVRTISADGGQQTQLTQSGGALRPSWSPDGNWIAYAGPAIGSCPPPFIGCSAPINLIHPDGSGLKMLTSIGNNADPDWQPLSPLTAIPARANEPERPPTCIIRAARRPRLRQTRSFEVKVRCDQQALIRASGRVSVARGRHRGRAKRFRLKLRPVTLKVGANRKTLLMLKLGKSGTRRVLAALRRHRGVSARFFVTASNSNGSTTSKARVGAVKLRS
jgi:TolB protein